MGCLGRGGPRLILPGGRRVWSLTLAAALVGAEPEILHVPADAVVHALADAATLDEDRRLYARWVWTDGSAKANAAVSFAANTAISKASVPVRLPAVAGGRLVRVELDTLLPKDADLKRAIELWEKQAGQDPAFYVEQQVKTAAYLADDGKTYDWKWAVAFGGWVDLKSAVLLQGLTKSAAPIQRAELFITRTLTQVDGGQYYDWAGIRKSQQQGRTDFEQFLEDHGVDKKRAAELRAERRSAIFRSGVTAKPRAIEEIQGLLGTVVWTEDPADNNLDPKAHPVLTLLSPKKDAIEAIALRSNGHCSFAIFDGQGKLANSVPDTIAKDHTIPVPFTARLQPAISCIRCHAQGSGFRTTRNDVNALLKGKPEDGLKFDIVGDERRGDFRDVVDRLAGLYRGSLDRLSRARDDYSDAVFLCTGGLSVGEVSGVVQAIDDGFRFSDVTPATACRELGVRSDDDVAVSMLRTLLPAASAPGGREDARIGFLKLGVTITRADWEAVLPDALLRSRIPYEALAKKAKVQE